MRYSIFRQSMIGLIIKQQLMQAKTNLGLPPTPQERESIIQQIQHQITKLQSEMKESVDDIKLVKSHEADLQLLKIRVQLISRCGELSLLRLNHLQEVFKHYSMHVFKTGKHMTFDRLQFVRLHMTIQRFFLFLKDFQLTVANIDQRKKQIIEKTAIITVFKKAASNARDLSFEEFIQCLEKLAVMYWDQKQGFHKKQEMLQLQRQHRRQLLEKRKRRKQGLKSENSVEKDKSDEQGDKKPEPSLNGRPPIQQKHPPNNENDDLVNELMNNQQIEDPNEQVRQIAAKAKQQNDVIKETLKVQKQQEQSLLRLTVDEKIEFYYQLIDIDSVDSYKHKLTSLNLPTFQQNHHQKQKQHGKALSESKLQAAQAQEEERLRKLKEKMNEKKQKFKDRPLPKPSNQQALKQQQKSRKRRQMKKQRQMSIKETKVEQEKKKQKIVKDKTATPKVQYREGEVTWQSIQKLTIDHLKLKQFNPNKLYVAEDDDKFYLQEYGAKPRMSSRLQARQRQSLSIVESTKQRAQQLEKKQKEKEKGQSTRVVRQNTSFSRNKI